MYEASPIYLCSTSCSVLDIEYNYGGVDVGIDHTNMTAPLPVCSAKLSMFGSG